VTRALPAWAEWSPAAPARPWSLGVEEEVMLLDPATWRLAFRIEDVLPVLPRELPGSVSAETHGAAVELATRPASSVAEVAGELACLRGTLAAALDGLGLRAAGAGTHPAAQWQETEIAAGERYQAIHETMRELARREPTFALHVHVGIPDPEQALQALVRLRAHLPALIALSANSPYWQGRDSGMAAVRLPVFGGFPRTGIPRSFADYADYVEAVDVLLRCGAFPEPTFLWWDLRLQPALGTLEVRVMDAQTRIEDVEALTALVQCLVRLEATGGHAPAQLVERPEVLDENRFLAARDGMDAALVDPARSCRRPVLDVVGELLAACAPHAEALGCAAQLRGVARLARCPGYARQRALAAGGTGRGGAALAPVTRGLADGFEREAAGLVASV
jgi:carboxylate-amine ligase